TERIGAPRGGSGGAEAGAVSRVTGRNPMARRVAGSLLTCGAGAAMAAGPPNWPASSVEVSSAVDLQR
ncbi:MAG TPA: hypothetical protein VNG73_11130, partial [Gemmatimonadaceae bacterium]|nr:hypothetical protein [Gemmatimonadaceae bacterium]